MFDSINGYLLSNTLLQQYSYTFDHNAIESAETFLNKTNDVSFNELFPMIYPAIADIYMGLGYKILSLYPNIIPDYDITVYRTSKFSIFDDRILHNCDIGDYVECHNYISTSVCLPTYYSGFHIIQSMIILIEITFNTQKHSGLYVSAYFGTYPTDHVVNNKYTTDDHNNTPFKLQGECEILIRKGCRFQITNKRVVLLRDKKTYQYVKKLVISLKLIEGLPFKNNNVIQQYESAQNVPSLKTPNMHKISFNNKENKFINVDKIIDTNNTYPTTYLIDVNYDSITHKDIENPYIEASKKIFDDIAGIDNYLKTTTDLFEKVLINVDYFNNKHLSETLINLLTDRASRTPNTHGSSKITDDVKGGGTIIHTIFILKLDSKLPELHNNIISLLTTNSNGIKLQHSVYGYNFVDRYITEIIDKIMEKMQIMPTVQNETLSDITPTNNEITTTYHNETLPNITPNDKKLNRIQDTIDVLKDLHETGQLTPNTLDTPNPPDNLHTLRTISAAGGSVFLSLNIEHIITTIIICLLVIILLYYLTTPNLNLSSDVKQNGGCQRSIL